MHSSRPYTHPGIILKTYPKLPVYHSFWIALIIGMTSLISAQAVTVYQNTFDAPSSLDDFTIYGATFPNYTSSPLHSVSIDAGQLRIDTDYYQPNGPGTPPTFLGRALLSMDTSSAFAPGYESVLSQNSGLISWSFDVSNQNGGFNNHFSCVLASTKANPYSSVGGFAQGYAFSGGGMVGNRMVIRRFDYGMGGGGEMLVDITDGLGTLPDKGSIRITFNPATSEWSLYGEIGVEYTDPSQVDNLLGTAIDDTYTNVETKYFGLTGRTTGTNYFDNLTVDVVPEPATLLFLICTSLGAVFVRRRMLP